MLKMNSIVKSRKENQTVYEFFSPIKKGAVDGHIQIITY